MELKKLLTDLLIDGLEDLIKLGSNSSFWGSTRVNSDAIIALTVCLPQFDYYRLRSKCLERINKECEENKNLVNWNEEIWDTSIAIMALSTDYENHKINIHKALNWIKTRYIVVSHSWNEEVWETLLALNAITYSGTKFYENSDVEDNYFEESISWITSLYHTPRKGILINWSSTALYLLFAINSQKYHLEDTNRAIVDDHIQSSCQEILHAALSLSEKVLWTSETWSNGLVLWAIAEARQGVFTEEKLLKIIYWFRERITSEETPVEDKAFACIGIYRYLEYLELLENEPTLSRETVTENLQNKLSKLINIRVKDFIPHPPVFDKSYYKDYYTINLNKRIVNITFIVIATGLLTYFSFQASNNNDSLTKWLSVIPILLGIFATVTQLANFNLKASKNKNKKDAE